MPSDDQSIRAGGKLLPAGLQLSGGLSSACSMRTFLILLLSLAALAVVAAVFIFDVFSEISGHYAVSGNEKIPFASVGMSREQYIAYLMRTEKPDDPELWRRIAAVRNLTNWPK